MQPDHQRRDFLLQTAALAATAQLGGCTGNNTQYTDINVETRIPLAPNSDSLELVGYATLAANGHTAMAVQYA